MAENNYFNVLMGNVPEVAPVMKKYRTLVDRDVKIRTNGAILETPLEISVDRDAKLYFRFRNSLHHLGPDGSNSSSSLATLQEEDIDSMFCEIIDVTSNGKQHLSLAQVHARNPATLSLYQEIKRFQPYMPEIFKQ